MKKLLLPLAVAASLALAIAGCVKMNLDTTIQKTGGGTLDLTFAFAPGTLDALKDLASTPGMSGPDKMPDLGVIDRDRLEAACRQAGVKLAKYEKTTVDGRDQTHVALDFKRIDDLTKVLEPAGSPQGALSLYKLPNGDYTIRESAGADGGEGGQASSDGGAPAAAQSGAAGGSTGSTAGSGSAAPASGDTGAPTAGAGSPDLKSPDQMKVDSEASQKAMAALGKLLATASELDLVMRITVPGDVISNNAMRVEGRTLIWQINAENVMTAGANLKPEIVFSGKGLDIDAPLWKGPAGDAAPAPRSGD